MRESRYSDQQIALALQQEEHGTMVGQVCRKIGISEQSFYRWNKKFGGMAQEAQAARGREPAPEAAGGGPHVRQADAPRGAPKKRLKPAARRKKIRNLQSSFVVSERRALRVTGWPRSTHRHQSQTALRMRLLELAADRTRYDYRRLTILLRRERWLVSAKWVYRLYREEELTARI